MSKVIALANNEPLALAQEHFGAKNFELKSSMKEESFLHRLIGSFSLIGLSAGTAFATFLAEASLFEGANPVMLTLGVVSATIGPVGAAIALGLREEGNCQSEFSIEDLKNTTFKKVGGSGYFKSLATQGKLPSSIEIGKAPNGQVIVRTYRVSKISSMVEMIVFEQAKEETAQDAWDRALQSAKMLSEGKS